MEIVGISKAKIEKISQFKKEDKWVTDYRLNSYEEFKKQSLPSFGPEIELDFSKIIYYKNDKQDEKIKDDWKQVLKPIREEMDSLGVIESEKHLDGIGVQWESEVIYHNMIKELEDKKVIFTSIEQAIKLYPDLVKK